MSTLPVSAEDPTSIRLLVVEDDDGLADLLLEIFAKNPDYATVSARVASLHEGVRRVTEADFDAVLLDLGLPDSEGLLTARRMIEAVTPPTAVVVFTSLRDQGVASQALALGVQEYVVKEDMTSQLVTRVVRYGVTRARLVHDLDRARHGEERERELRRMERLSADAGGTTSISAAMLGDRTVAQRLGPRYESELVVEYRRILQHALDEQAYRGDETNQDDLRSLANVLGFLGAGPRDVIELHTMTLRRLAADADPNLMSALAEEGRVAVLQLMGRLAAFYRDRSIGAGRSAERGATPDTVQKERS